MASKSLAYLYCCLPYIHLPSPPLARWPVHHPATHDMDMEMIDRLSSLNTIVNHQSVPLGQSLLLGHLLGSKKEVAQQFNISIFSFLYHSNPLFWNNQEMDRCLRSNIHEGNTLVILMNKLGRNGSIQDLVKDGWARWPPSLDCLSFPHLACSILLRK